MPLIPSKSKKAFSKNVETEMEHGKPQKQSLAIAFNVKRKAGKKKYAEGGKVNESAASEHRPMPEEKDKDAAMVSRNSGDKAPKQDSWVGQPTTAQAQSNNGRMVKPIKRPSMVPSNAFSTRMYGEEADLEMSAKPGPYGEQPPKHDDEEGPDRQGPSTPDLKLKRMAKGGMINDEVSMHDAEEDMVEHPAGLEEDDDQMRPSEDEYMAGHFAKGGIIDQEPAREDKGWGAVILKADGGEVTKRRDSLNSEEPIHDKEYHSDEEALDHHMSMAAAIMAKKRMMAKGGEILSHDSIYSDDSDQVDLSRNADEDANEEDQTSFNALRKENYSESEGLKQLDSPSDSNEDGREIEHDKHGMLDEIRSRMKRRIR